MAEPTADQPRDLSAYVERVEEALRYAPSWASDAAVEALRSELEELADLRRARDIQDDAIRAVAAVYMAMLTGGDPVEQALKSLDAMQSQVDDDSNGEQ